MQTTTQHSNTRCPVYLHPAACTSPAAVEAIQRQTGLLVIINGPRSAITAPKPAGDFGPFGDDAA
ncbi:hypothetical protein RBU55_07420 [Pseudomonas chlororaphis subsp. aurantiaca]|uniref:hypothetical protein n=1 Tax=Pseudomonas chlororaphis TaxID=587753 RepID=UPI0027DB7DFB|nr:hypothetical protein [Pseudomonas chlororaphis]WMJ01373.1 hypothetical protein RBU55_07420 [Pseudomonas chlororaphis subsp. aurantiaca]